MIKSVDLAGIPNNPKQKVKWKLRRISGVTVNEKQLELVVSIDKNS